ncbi:MAG: hypothetical protein H0V88_02930 [Pyrinomonadaceae bacterium]|jgi:hypothetical protein|nr:hypothetical protein [Pyrinomonadaceae bacterium]
MKNTRAFRFSSRCFCLSLLIVLASLNVFAQRARTVGNSSDQTASAASLSPAPTTVRAKYEGGLFGYNRKIDGTLTFDDANQRLLFRNKQGQETFSIPYDSIAAAFADTRSRRPTAATVISSLPVPYGLNLPALFVRKKYRYLTMQYSDPDTNAAGVTSFKLDNKEILASMLQAVATKAGLTQRGEIFVRRKEDSNGATMRTTVPTPPDLPNIQ